MEISVINPITLQTEGLMIMDSHCQSAQEKPFCKIRGRMIRAKDLNRKIENLCKYHHIQFDERFIERLDATAELQGQLAAIEELYNSQVKERGGVIIILEVNVPYESSWGGYGHLPDSILNIDRTTFPNNSPSGFIAPYLTEYRLACRAVKLSCNEEGTFTITLPDHLLDGANCAGIHSLTIRLETLVDRDENGDITPVSSNGTCKTFVLGKKGVQKITDSGFSWVENRLVPIGPHLGSEMLDFKESNSDCGTGLLAGVLLPEMGLIVTDETPQLRAAEILLLHQFSVLIDELHDKSIESDGRIFCIAGLNIDMSRLGRGQAGYFIPWKAYGCTRKHEHDEGLFDQDDIFTELMGQDQKTVSAARPSGDS